MVYGDYHGRETERKIFFIEGGVFMAYAQAGTIWGTANNSACG
jgi:hypothetical protein